MPYIGEPEGPAPCSTGQYQENLQYSLAMDCAAISFLIEIGLRRPCAVNNLRLSFYGWEQV